MKLEDFLDTLMHTSRWHAPPGHFRVFAQQQRMAADLDREVAELKKLDVLVGEAELRLRAHGWLGDA